MPSSHSICFLDQDMKYWRVRFLLLPRRDLSDENTKYSGDTKMIEIEGFLKFIEGLNGIKRPINQRMLFICRVCIQVSSLILTKYFLYTYDCT